MNGRMVQLIGGPQDGVVVYTSVTELRFPVFDMQFGVMSHAVYRLDRITEHGFIARFVEEVIVHDG